MTERVIYMADQMAKCLGDAMQPLNVDARAEMLRRANRWREEYLLARAEMQKARGGDNAE